MSSGGRGEFAKDPMAGGGGQEFGKRAMFGISDNSAMSEWMRASLSKLKLTAGTSPRQPYQS